MVSFGQTTESTIESASVEAEAAEVNASPTDDENGTDDDISGQPGPPAAIEVEIQRHINELRNELLDDRASTVDWWLAALTVVLGFFAIVVVLGGYIGFSRFREIESEAKNSVKAAAEHALAAKRYVNEIERNRDKSNDIIRRMNAETAADNPEEANQAIESVRENPEASLVDKAIAHAISVQQEGNRDDATEKWRAVAHIAEEGDHALAARAWFSVGYLLQDKDPKGSVSAYDKVLRLEPDYAAYNNRGVAKAALNQHEDAIADYEEALRLDPDYADAYLNRGNSKRALNQHEDAIADYEEALRLDPDYADAYNNRGRGRHRRF